MIDQKLKPLYMLIKVEVDAGIVYDQARASAYAMNHCNSLEYQLIDYFYPSKYSEQYGHSKFPFIKLWRNTSDYWQLLPTAL